MSLPRHGEVRATKKPGHGALSPDWSERRKTNYINNLAWLGRQDSNLGMAVPKTAALPLGYAPASDERKMRQGARRVKPGLSHLAKEGACGGFGPCRAFAADGEAGLGGSEEVEGETVEDGESLRHAAVIPMPQHPHQRYHVARSETGTNAIVATYQLIETLQAHTWAESERAKSHPRWRPPGVRPCVSQLDPTQVHHGGRLLHHIQGHEPERSLGPPSSGEPAYARTGHGECHDAAGLRRHRRRQGPA